MRMSIKTAEDLAAEAIASARAQLVAAVDAHVEDRARAMGYNSAAHLASYVSSTIPGWAAEAAAFVAWRDAVWIAAYQQQAEAEVSGQMPTAAQLIAALPEWAA